MAFNLRHVKTAARRKSTGVTGRGQLGVAARIRRPRLLLCGQTGCGGGAAAHGRPAVPDGLLLCGHHYGLARAGLAAVGAAVYDEAGGRLTTANGEQDPVPTGAGRRT
jgi:hypothetical protein